MQELSSDEEVEFNMEPSIDMAQFDYRGPDMNKRMDSIQDMLKAIGPSIAMINTVSQDVKDIKSSTTKEVNELKTKVVKLEDELHNMRDSHDSENNRLTHENKKLRDHILKLESYSRRNNLILRGLRDTAIPLESAVKKIFVTKMNLTQACVDKLMFEDMHRLPQGQGQTSDVNKPNPVIMKFVIRSDWALVWNARENLDDTTYSLSLDIPEAYRVNRSILRPILTLAKKSDKFAKFVGDKLKYRGNMYEADALDKLPVELDLKRSCVRESDQAIVFFGRHTPFSNFFRRDYSLDHVDYSSIEQFLQSERAVSMGDERTAHKIMATDEPLEQKKLSYSARGNVQAWEHKAKECVYRAVKAKFSTHDDLRTYLLGTGTKTLGEASTDVKWGIGISLRDDRCTDPNQWKGPGWLGEILMRVRSEL